MKQLETAREVNDALGVETVSALTGRKLTTVYKWQEQNSFPPSSYFVMTEELEKIGCVAPRALWRMMESVSQSESEEEAADA